MQSKLSFPFSIKGSLLPSKASSKSAATGSGSSAGAPGSAGAAGAGAGPSESSIPLKRKASNDHNPMPAPPQPASKDDTGIAFKLPPGISEDEFFAFLKHAGMPTMDGWSTIGGPSHVAVSDMDPPLPTNIPSAGIIPVAAPSTSAAAAEVIEIDDDDDDDAPPPTMNCQPATTAVVPSGSRVQARPPAPKKGGNGIVPRIADFIQRVRMLTGTVPNPSTAMGGSGRDVFLRGLEVGAGLIQTRTERGTLAMHMCRVWVEHKARTDEELFTRERFDDYVEFVDRCIFPTFKQMAGVFDGDVSAEDMPDDDDTEVATPALEAKGASRRRGRPPKPKDNDEKEKEHENSKGKKKATAKAKKAALDFDE